MSTPHAVLGLAGHVDHGKTSLVAALTGHQGDRLPEEKRRGITIDLGFSRWSMPERGVDLSVIDVPGHERFVAAMAAGASGVDLALLVVAADDGVMPQTREHLAALGVLGVSRGVVAVTKIDLAPSDEERALVDLDLDEHLAGTFLAKAPRVRVSSRDGTGLDALRDAIADAVRALPPREAASTPWLAIDRAFVRHGHGTVVTGTLVRGAIAVGDALEALPVQGGARAVTVRSLAIFGDAVERAEASTRLALQLRGADPSELPRGVVLTRPGAQRATTSLDAQLVLVPDAPPFSSRTAIVMHAGAAQAVARVRLLEPPTPGAPVRARLTLDAPIATHAGQRFVLRRPELVAQTHGTLGHATIGGGEVLDPHPALARPRRSLEAALPEALEARLVRMVGERARGAVLRELAERMPLDTALRPTLDALVRRGALVAVSDGAEARWLSPRHEAKAREAVLDALARFHAEHPALSGATPAELAGRVPAALRALVPRALAGLLAEGALLGGARVSLRGHDARASADRVAEAYLAEGLAPRIDEAVREALGMPERTFRDAIRELLGAARLHRIATGLYVHADSVEVLATRVRAHLDAQGSLSPGDLKALAGVSRKHLVPLLEHLDRIGVTQRRGDDRIRA